MLVAAAPLAPAESARAQDAAQLLVVVRTEDTDAPLANASVQIVELAAGGMTNAEGRFLRTGLLPGRITVSIEHPGYQTARAVVGLDAGKRTRVDAVLGVAPVEHEPVEVRSRRGRTQAFREFYDRVERRGGGHFITRERIEEARPRQFSELLREIPNMRLDCSNWQQCKLLTRGAPLSGVTRDCPVQFYVNGVYQPYSDINMLSPNHIEGVEVYPRGRGAPGRYTMRRNARCGIVLVWLRDRR